MAHASMASLMRTIESLLTSNSLIHSLICDYREELCALLEKVSSLEVFVKNFEKNNVFGEMMDFEVEKESTKIQDKGKQVSKESLVHDFSSSTNDILNVNNNMVGHDDQKEHLLEDQTTSYFGEPKVIPIVRMGGIGKTTLAKEAYIYGSMLCRFDVCSKATVSQQYNIKKILLSLLQSTIEMDDTVKMKGEVELVDMLQKSLKRKSYLIVLDDIWSCEVWDGVRRCFPTEDNAGNQILLTTHNDEVACYAGIENISLRMSFMDQDESCSLFKNATFLLELWNLQTFIVKGSFVTCPVQIWGLMQLRHLKLSTCYLPDCPSGSVDKGRHLDFSNLQTISYLSARCCMKEVIVEIQNVKELGIRQDENDYGCSRYSGLFNNLVHLHQLETLSFIHCFHFLPASVEAFPATLKKLKLKRTFLTLRLLILVVYFFSFTEQFILCMFDGEDADDEDEDEDDETTTTMRMMVMVVVLIMI
ncbi:hypothetical protein BC332_24413 [Capsicum chinense]|nr:hypothetical protein BC332_24413 [Capsicum chinense]